MHVSIGKRTLMPRKIGTSPSHLCMLNRPARTSHDMPISFLGDGSIWMSVEVPKRTWIAGKTISDRIPVSLLYL